MKTRKSNFIQLAILAGLGLAAILSLALPQALRTRRDEPLLSLSVVQIGRASCRERV